MNNIGVIVGADAGQEWLLPWWWDNFRKFCSYPVTFFDFGLSNEMKKWVEERGSRIELALPTSFVKSQEDIHPSLVKEWEEIVSDVLWTSRKQWFKKPFACLASPYEWTLWLDLDCIIVGPIDPILNPEHFLTGFAIAKDVVCREAYQAYNSGVIGFCKNHPLICAWVEESLRSNGQFRSDQEILSFLIFEKKITISILDPIYNWNVKQRKNSKARIYHFIGNSGKNALQQVSIGKFPFLKNIPINYHDALDGFFLLISLEN